VKHRLSKRINALERRLTPRPSAPYVCFTQRGETEAEALARYHATYGDEGRYLIVAPPLLTMEEWMAIYGHRGTVE
jgi:hypothetical protein